MTQIGEVIAIGIAKDIDEECPFQLPDPKAVKEEGENIAKDDRPGAAGIQRSSGGTLGKNLTNASQGAKGTVNELFAASPAEPDPAQDTRRSDAGKVRVKGDANEYPFTVAAHHLIPGNASLAKSRLYEKYMKKGGKVKTRSGREYTMKENIGYNVNGAHNGVWLPGNYAIRRATSPKRRVSWGKLGAEFDEWKTGYMLACVKKTRGQFHDTHVTYSEKVLGVLNRMHREFVLHQDTCEECKGKTKVAPPYMLKLRLYGLSSYLRGKLRSIPDTKWKVPWYTSDKFRDAMVKAGLLE
jgi:hypothetical protein